MYTVKNFKTKKALREAVESGATVDTYQPGGMFPPTTDGKVYLEGPHYPEPHRWYASATVANGIIMMGSVR
jgi:hypothetical protein